MTSLVMFNAKIYLDTIDYSAQSNKATLSVSRAELEDSSFGDTSKVYKPGLREVGFSAEMHFDPTVTDANLFSRIEGVSKPLTACADNGAFDDTAYTFNAGIFEYDPIGETHGEMLKSKMAAMTVKDHGGLGRGKILINQSITNDLTTSGVNIGPITASKKLISNYHIIAINASSCVLKIQAATGPTFAIGDGYETVVSGTTLNLQCLHKSSTNILLVGATTGSTVLRYNVGAEFMMNVTPSLVTLPAASGTIGGITYTDAGGLFLAVGDTGQIATSTDDGVTWVSRTSGVTSDLKACVTIPGAKYIAVGSVDAGTGVILKSTDGTTFSRKTSIAFGHNAICFMSGTTYIIVGAGGSILVSTDTGDTWSESTDSRIETTENLLGVVSNGTNVISVGDNGKIITASVGNLNVWTTRTSGTSANISGVSVSGTTFYAVCSSSSEILKSTDNGITWTIVNSGSNKKAIYIDSKRLITAGSSGDIQTSTAAINVVNHAITGGSGPVSESLSINGNLEMRYYRAFADITGTSCQLVSAIGIASDS